MSDIKVAILQEGTTEYDYPVEHEMQAEDVDFDGSPTDLTATDVKLALQELAIRNHGKDYSSGRKVSSETTTGSSYSTYATLNLVATGSYPATPNKYRINADFVWGHNSAANDILVRLVYGTTVLKELRIEPKDTGSDQRLQNNILITVDDIPAGTYPLELQYKPAVSSRTSRMFEAVIEVWRTE